MTWTYSGNPSASALDEVRFLIGDTDTTDQLLSNEEINYQIAEQITLLRVCSESCFAIAAKFARLMSRNIGGLSADFSAKYNQYYEMANAFLARDILTPVRPFISGYKIAQKEAVELDTDRETTFSRKGVMDNRRTYPTDDYTQPQYRNT